MAHEVARQIRHVLWKGLAWVGLSGSKRRVAQSCSQGHRFKFEFRLEPDVPVFVNHERGVMFMAV